MTATRLARGLFAFQIPALLAAVIGVGFELAQGGDVRGVISAIFAAPLSVALLLGSLITWALEQRRPLASPRWTARIARYELPSFLLALLPIAFYGWLAGAFMRSDFQLAPAVLMTSALVGGYLVIAAVPIVFLARWGAVTPPRS